MRKKCARERHLQESIRLYAAKVSWNRWPKDASVTWPHCNCSRPAMFKLWSAGRMRPTWKFEAAHEYCLLPTTYFIRIFMKLAKFSMWSTYTGHEVLWVFVLRCTCSTAKLLTGGCLLACMGFFNSPLGRRDSVGEQLCIVSWVGWLIDKMATARKKSRTITEEKRRFQPNWEPLYLVEEINNNVICMLCDKSLPLKTCNIKRHYESNHSEYIAMEVEQPVKGSADLCRSPVKVTIIVHRQHMRLPSYLQR